MKFQKGLRVQGHGENTYKTPREHQCSSDPSFPGVEEGIKTPEDFVNPTPVSTNSSCKPLMPKAVKGTVQIKRSIPLTSSQWENSWDISVKARMQSSGPNLFAEEQWSTPACTVEKVGAMLPSASHPGRELRKMTEIGGSRGQVCSEDTMEEGHAASVSIKNGEPPPSDQQFSDSSPCLSSEFQVKQGHDSYPQLLFFSCVAWSKE